MLVLALLLILIALLVGFGAVYDGGESSSVEILGQQLTTTVAGVFLAGAATMLLLLLGVALLMGALKRARRRRVQRKETKQRQQSSVQQLEEERAALRAENERLAEQLSGTSAPMGAAAAGSTTATAGEASQSHGGMRGLMDKVTGHAQPQQHEQQEAPVGADTGTGTSYEAPAYDATAYETPTHEAPAYETPTRPAGSSDRIIDSTTDLTSHEQTSTTGRHRDTI